MSNVRKHTRGLCAAAVALCAATAALTGCHSEADRQRASADSLVNVAADLIAHRQFEEAFAVIDTLNARYPQQIEARRKATMMQSEAMGEYSQMMLTATDSLIALHEARIERLKPLFTHVPGEGIPGYYRVTAAHDPHFLTANGIEARVDDDDFTYYIVAINNGPHIGIRQLALSGQAGTMASGVIPDDSGRGGDIAADGIDMASFMAREIDDLVTWSEDNAAGIDRAVLTGVRGGTVNLRLKPETVQSLVLARQLSESASTLQKARLDRERYQRQLVIARDHSANLE